MFVGNAALDAVVAQRLGDGHIWKTASVFDETADVFARQSQIALARLSEQTDLARGRKALPREDLEQRRFACAVVADETIDRALRHVHVDIFQRVQTAVIFAELGGFDDVRVHIFSLQIKIRLSGCVFLTDKRIVRYGL